MTGGDTGDPAKRVDRPKLFRRELLQGRLGKLLRGTAPSRIEVRYPKTLEDVEGESARSSGGNDSVHEKTCGAGEQSDSATPPAAGLTPAAPRTINGIAIEPVAPTNLNAPAAPPPLPIFRPPGAVPEDRFLAGCTRCGDCITACPHNAITQAPQRFGSVAGTPVIQAEVQACLMCEDFPCISACPERVLKASGSKTIGTARITPQLCLAHQPQSGDDSLRCNVCSEQCPVPEAIAWIDGKPQVVESSCTGCGICRQVCPAPENAILLMPLFHRPG